ncbi:PDGLE domain-containing protein [Saccharomonospora iraqiensis]|uniref:PDGLE domain-containing protein n=1 Tax=Saccharomonospora iraqiensis TaxID=52698 RepID=UPI00022E157F|nr:PDGLE domain-containing protein [Saccharomonospora iraqiensis]
MSTEREADLRPDGAGRRRRGVRFSVVLGLAALLLAGVVSYLADGSPDGLESVTRQGCTEVDGELRGDCAAQAERGHDLAGSVFADYTLGGDETFTGFAGVLGVLVTLAVTVVLVWLPLRRRRSRQGGSGR